MATTNPRFRELQGYTRALNVLGWIGVASGLILFVVGTIGLLSGRGNEIMLLGVGGILAGIGTVVSAGFIDCVVSIENAAQEVVILLERLTERTGEKVA